MQLGGHLVIDTPTDQVPGIVGPQPAFQDSRTLAFRSLDGQTLLPLNGRLYVGRQGMAGLDLPPVNITTDTAPGVVGGRLRSIQYTPRDVFIPLYLRSQVGHGDLLDMRDTLDALLDFGRWDYATEDGTLDVVAESLRGPRSLRCVFAEDTEGELTRASAGVTWQSYGLRFLAVRPLWNGGTWSTRPIRQASGAGWFGRFPGRLAPGSHLAGDVTVTVPGDVASWPTITATGPCTSLTITGDGLAVPIPDGLAEDETVVVTTDPRARAAVFNGVSRPDRIGYADLYAPLRPGAQTLAFALTGTTKASSAQVSGVIWHRRPW